MNPSRPAASSQPAPVTPRLCLCVSICPAASTCDCGLHINFDHDDVNENCLPTAFRDEKWDTKNTALNFGTKSPEVSLTAMLPRGPQDSEQKAGTGSPPTLKWIPHQTASSPPRGEVCQQRASTSRSLGHRDAYATVYAYTVAYATSLKTLVPRRSTRPSSLPAAAVLEGDGCKK